MGSQDPVCRHFPIWSVPEQTRNGSSQVCMEGSVMFRNLTTRVLVIAMFGVIAFPANAHVDGADND